MVVACAALPLNLTTVQIALVLAAVLLAVAAVRHPGVLQTVLSDGRPIHIAVGGLFAAVLVSQLLTPVGFPGWAAVLRCKAWLGYFPLALVLGLGGPATRRTATLVLLAGATVAAVLGVVQHFSGIHPNAELLGIPPDQWQIRAPTDPDRFAAVGLFYNRTRYAHVIAVPLCLAIGLALWWPNPRLRVVGTAVAAVVATALVLSFTRAALAAVILAVIIGVLRHLRRMSARTRGGALAGLTVVALLVLAVPSTRLRAASALDAVANNDRRFIWARAFEIVQDFGATGVGFGGYGLMHAAYYDPVDPTFAMRSQAHNLLLTFLVEMGPLGVLMLLGLAVVVLREAACRGDEGSGDQALARAAGVALVALFGISMFHDPLYQAIEAHAFFVPVALLAAIPRRSEALS